MKYNWNIREKISDDLVDQLLYNRNISLTDKEIFLRPNWQRDTYSPFLFSKMTQAVDRIFSALESRQIIMIHGDYDADGVSGSAILFSTLEDIARVMRYQPQVKVFLPDRERDGYGVALHTVERFIKEEVKLLITVDCGIANAQALETVHEANIDVIICDHHQLADEIPQHALIIHPLMLDETYPNKILCGTGVAFKLASALIIEAQKKGADFPNGYEKWLMDLVSIATVTDVMPLVGENRVLEWFGLKTLNKTRRLGLKKIIELSNTEFGIIDTQAIGFRIGPRLNAAGRISNAKIAFNALVSRTEEEAQKYATELEILNRDRQKITQVAYEEARAIVAKRTNACVHVISCNVWKPGIIGLIAGKIVAEFGVPAFVFTQSGNNYVGSGRSVGGFHLVEAMRACGDIFVKFGGHPQACGLTLASVENLTIFEEKVSLYAQNFFMGKTLSPELSIDAELSFELANEAVYQMIKEFEPFGNGNPEPTFVSKGIVADARAVGASGDHLKIVLRTESGIRDLIGFGLGSYVEQLPNGSTIECVYQISINEWNGNRTIQGKIIDIK